MPNQFHRLRIRNRADDANLIVLSSDLDATHCLLTEPPEAEGQKIDWAEGKLETGTSTWCAWDEEESEDTRTITALLGDENARDQILGNVAIWETSEDASDWDPVQTGHLIDYDLKTAGEFRFVVGDTDRREQRAELFRTVTETFDRASCLIGGPIVAPTPVVHGGTPKRAFGPQLDYGPVRFVVIGNSSGGSPNPANLVNDDNRVTLSLVSGRLPPLYDRVLGSFVVELGFAGLKLSFPAEEIDRLARKYFEFDAEGLYRTTSAEQSQPWGSFPGLEVKMTAVVGGAVKKSFPIAQATRKASETLPIAPSTDFPLGDHSALVANSNDWLIVHWDVATMGAQPALGIQFDVLVYPRAIDKDNPIHLRGHPLDLHTAANDQEGIPYDSASAASTKTAIGEDIVAELRIGGPLKYAAFTQVLKQAFGYGVRYNAAGEQEFFPTRATPAAVGTITANDIVGDPAEGPTEVILRVSTRSVISGVDYKLRSFILWNPKVDENERPMDGIIERELLVEGRRAVDAVPGDRILTYDLPGQILLQGDADVFNQAAPVREWIEEGGDVIIDRRGWGAREGSLEVLETVPGQVGDYLDSEAPHQVNMKDDQDPVSQRGGTRKWQIVGRTKRNGKALLELEDAGNLAQDPPEAPDDGTGGNDPNEGIPVPELSLAPSDDAPNTIATVTVENAADIEAMNGDVYLEYAVQETEPTEAGTPFGPVHTSAGEDELDLPAILSGQTIWVRGQTRILATGQISEWSEWISITLGPATNDPNLTLSLTYTITTSGVVTVHATTNGTSVKFALAPAGETEASDADVRAATPDTSAPFEAVDIVTLAFDEFRHVSAFAYDDLGNESVKVTIRVERPGNDDGIGQGTPGDFVITMRAGPALNLLEIAAALTVHDDDAATDWKYHNLSHVRAMRVHGGSGVAGSAGTELALVYSLDGGDSWAELGPTMPLDVVKYPSLGAWTAIAEEARRDNVLLGWATKGGDDEGEVEVGNIYVDATSSANPPPSEEGEPPETPDPETPPVPDPLFWMRGGDEMFSDSAGTTPQETDGGALGRWGDKTGNGWHFTGAGGLPKRNDTESDRGIPCVEFTAADLEYFTQNTPFAGLQTATFAIRWKKKAATPPSAAAAGTYHYGRNRVSNDTALRWTNGIAYEAFGRSFQIISPLAGRDFSAWNDWVISFDHPSRRYRAWFNGAGAINNITDPDSAGGVAWPTVATLGRNRTTTQYLDGYVDEVIGWDVEVSDAQAAAIHAFLSATP